MLCICKLLIELCIEHMLEALHILETLVTTLQKELINHICYLLLVFLLTCLIALVVNVLFEHVFVLFILIPIIYSQQ